jgi:hypothetical protein
VLNKRLFLCFFSGVFRLRVQASWFYHQEWFQRGVNVSVGVSAGFGWPFYFAVVVAGLCVAARFCHQKVDVADGVVPPPSPQ